MWNWVCCGVGVLWYLVCAVRVVDGDGVWVNDGGVVWVNDKGEMW